MYLTDELGCCLMTPENQQLLVTVAMAGFDLIFTVTDP